MQCGAVYLNAWVDKEALLQILCHYETFNSMKKQNVDFEQLVLMKEKFHRASTVISIKNNKAKKQLQ